MPDVILFVMCPELNPPQQYWASIHKNNEQIAHIIPPLFQEVTCSDRDKKPDITKPTAKDALTYLECDRD